MPMLSLLQGLNGQVLTKGSHFGHKIVAARCGGRGGIRESRSVDGLRNMHHQVFRVLNLNSMHFVKDNFSRKGATLAKVIYLIKPGVFASWRETNSIPVHSD